MDEMLVWPIHDAMLMVHSINGVELLIPLMMDIIIVTKGLFTLGRSNREAKSQTPLQR